MLCSDVHIIIEIQLTVTCLALGNISKKELEASGLSIPLQNISPFEGMKFS